MNSKHLMIGTICGLAAATAASTANAASVTYSTFTGDGAIPGLSVSVNDHVNPGDLTFTAQIDTGLGYIADIFGLYFDLDDDSLVSGLQLISGTDITASQFSANSVSSLGGGNNMNGAGDGPYDAGVQFGNNGIGAGKGDHQFVTLRLGHLTESLTIDNLVRVGLRLQSVGEIGGGRGGSSKLVGTPDRPDKPDCPPGTAIPTPAAAGIGLAMLGITALRRRRAV